MENDQVNTPQVHLIGKISGAAHFDKDEVYLKYSFKTGDQWTLLEGKPDGDSFQAKGQYEKVIPIELAFDLNYKTESIRGWPKLFVEVWQVDGVSLISTGRNSIAGYGIASIPVQPGEYKLTIPCWRPKGTFYDKLIGSNPELVHKDILISSDSRFGLKTESTGSIIVEVQVVTKDFDFWGVKINPTK